MQKSRFWMTLLLFFANAAWATPAQVLIIRHAEKPASGDDLSPTGDERANALVNYFEKNPKVTEYGTPVAIYAEGYDEDDNGKGKSERAVETVTPLANALGLKIHDEFMKSDTKELAKEILASDEYKARMVLICWEHNKIPKIAEQLGADNAPDSWDDSDFWSVWKLDFKHHAVSGFDIFSEDLMPGDPSH